MAEESRDMGVPEIMIGAAPGVRVAPAIDMPPFARGLMAWPATVVIGPGEGSGD